MRRKFDEWAASLGEHWNRFWFSPSENHNLTRTRVPVCILAALWFAIATFNSEWWFGEAGWNADDLARRLSVASEGDWPARFRVSPLWSAENPLWFRIWAGVGGLLAVLGALGIGGRALMLLLFICALCLAQRLSWTTGAFEPLLVAVLGYLAIDCGRSLIKNNVTTAHASWTATLATRLLQSHVWLVLAAGFAFQLSSLAWWRADAVWWLAVTEHSNLFSVEALRGKLLIVNALGHGMVLASLVACGALWSQTLRPIGLICGCAVGVAYALVGDQVLYGLLLISVLIGAFGSQLPPREGS